MPVIKLEGASDPGSPPSGGNLSPLSGSPWGSGLSSAQLAAAAERRRARARKMGRKAKAEEREGIVYKGEEGPPSESTDENAPLTKKQARMIRNRESAALSRKRKRDQIEALELEVEQLKEKNKQLKQRLSRYETGDPRATAPASASASSSTSR
jgi:hypothetical protein